jgi:hypothetical protein
MACLVQSLFLALLIPQAGVQVVTGTAQTALAYLAQEVPLWKTDNGCYSCHNNGDGARVLYVAQRLGWEQPEAALADTTAWLADPEGWDSNRGAPEFSDKKLASIQFAAALEAAVAAGFASRDALVEAGQFLLPHQEEDGSWQVDARGSIGSPITYGPALATYTARRVLKAANERAFDDAIQLADGWFVRSDPKNVLDAAATVLAFANLSSDGETKDAAVALILDAQNSDGGWGPFARSPSEPFDTALALLALESLGDSHREQVARGRGYLRETQLSPGGWPETTRPPGSQSYAQHISTSAWATLALLETAK